MFSSSTFLILFVAGTALGCGPPGTTRGGFCPIDANDPVVQEMAQFAVKTHAEKMNAVNSGTITVSQASSQVVSGYNYKMTVTTSFNAQVTECHFVVYDQSWTNTRELTTDECHVIHNQHLQEGRLMLLKLLHK
ncbi:uncharacterized protein LOC134276274 [Saccostrea cucullata]|uniref:uncharacterized protein LOC134276274 n=1 Tax=Saccostrea cuccullata TaxID=36930 RepID=UPI002ED35DA9